MKRSRNTLMIHAWLLCFVVLSSFGLSRTAAHSASWQPGPPLGTARDQFAGGVINGKIYVFGGNGNPNGVNLKSTEMLDPGLGSWVYKANNNHCAWGTEEVSGAVLHGKFYAIGDYDGSCNSSVEEYDPETDTWTSKAPLPTPRSGATAVAYNNRIYVFGSMHTGVVEAYDPANDSWETVTKMPKTITGYAVAVVADKAYVIGGYSESEERLVTDIYVYNLITDTWAKDSFAPLPHPRVLPFSSAAPVVNGKIYLIGGIEATSEDHGPSSKVDIYDTASDTWQAGTPLPTPTECHLSVIVDDTIYVVGGGTGYDGDIITADVWKYSLLNHKPTIGALTPISKTSSAGVAQTFTATYNDVDGYSDLKTVDFQVSPTGTGANAIWARYSSATNKLNLYNNTLRDCP